MIVPIIAAMVTTPIAPLYEGGGTVHVCGEGWLRWLFHTLMLQNARRAHDMWTVSVLLALCEGNHRSPVDFLHKGPVMRRLDF